MRARTTKPRTQEYRIQWQPPKRPRNLKDFSKLNPKNRIGRRLAKSELVSKAVGLSVENVDAETLYEHTVQRRRLAPQIQGQTRMKVTLMGTIKQVLGWVKPTYPWQEPREGVQLVFPLQAAASSGEFVAGVLRLLAPQARVTFLVTPRHQLADNPQARANLNQHLKRSILPTTQIVRIIDFHIKGNTLRAITEELHKNGFKGTIEPSLSPTGFFYGPNAKPFNAQPILSFIERFEPGEFKVPPVRTEMRGAGTDHFTTAGWKKDEKGKQVSGADKRLRRYLFNLGVAAARSFQESQAKEEKRLKSKKRKQDNFFSDLTPKNLDRLV